MTIYILTGWEREYRLRFRGDKNDVCSSNKSKSVYAEALENGGFLHTHTHTHTRLNTAKEKITGFKTDRHSCLSAVCF